MTAPAYGLTEPQAQALRFIGAFFARNGYAPTYEQICVGTGMSPTSKSGMCYRIKALRARGYLLAQDHVRQSIRLTEAGVAYCARFRHVGGEAA